MLFMYWKLTLVFHFLWQERLGKGGGGGGGGGAVGGGV